MMKIGNQTCDFLIYQGMIPQPNNDISGLGVILAFVISAYLTLAIVLYAYVFGYVDHTLLRPVDIYVHRRSARNAHCEDETYIAIRQCSLAFSDQQIVTGIAILIAGFIGFANQMSVYHFQIVIYLGWMSSSVHLSALTMLSTFLRERRALLSWRITGMLCLLVLLTVAIFPTSSDMWAVDNSLSPDDSDYTGWAVPAKCFLFQTYGQGVNADGPLSIILLVSSYLWKVGGLFESPRRFFRTWVRGPSEYHLERLLKRQAKLMKARPTRTNVILYRCSLSLYAFVFANFEFFSSFAASLWLSLIGLVWGTMEIFVPRSENSWWTYQENIWTFGQITPLVLLIQPLGAILEHCGEGARQHRERLTIRRLDRLTDNIEEPKGTRGSSLLRHIRNPSRSRPNVSKAQTRPLSDVFAELELKRPSERPMGDLLGHQRMMYNFRFMTSLIVWIQVATLAISSSIICIDGLSIGYEQSINWLLLLIAIPAWIGWVIVWSFAFIPFSRMSK